MNRASSSSAYATSFVGRGRDLSALDALFEGGARLVTVIGPGGIGKTRLACEFAGRYERAAGARAWFCDLALASNPGAVCLAVARALDVALPPGADDATAAAHLGAVLAARGPALVVLDNFEQVVACAPETVSRWLASAPDARLLVTSRERLHIGGESLLDLEPLSLPMEGGDAMASEAVELFLARARAVRRGFAPDAHGAAAVASLVRRLDGIPLAIELAAARARSLGPEQLLAHLSRPFELLSRGGRDACARQATLEAAIEWSWNLLGPWERRALAQCSVFRGGFDEAAAWDVLDMGDHSDAPTALAAVETLRDKSLLRAYEPTEFPGEVRFALYESIRDFARARLEAMDAVEGVSARHAAHFLRAGAAWCEGADGPFAAVARGRLVLEGDNLREVHRWSLAATPPRAMPALRAALALEPVSFSRGPADAHLAMLDGAIDAATRVGVSSGTLNGPVDPAVLVRAVLARGGARLRRGRVADGLADLEAALSAAERAGNQGARGAALRSLGHYWWVQGHIAEAASRFEEALASAAAAADCTLEARVLNDLGSVALLRGAPDEACALFDQSLRLHRESGEQGFAAAAVANLGAAAHENDRLGDARDYYERALEMLREVGDRRGEASVLGDLATLAHEQGRTDEARALFESCLGRCTEVGARQQEGLYRGYRAMWLEDTGSPRDARRAYEDALAIDREVGNTLAEGLLLAWMGRFEATRGDAEASRRALDAADERLATIGDEVRGVVASLCRGHLELCLARRAEDAGNVTDAATMRVSAAARALVACTAAPGGVTPAQRSVDVRCALRALERALERSAHDRRVADRAESVRPPAPRGVLRVAASGRSFCAPGGEEVSLLRRGSLRLLLKRMAESRRDAPGVALDITSLFDAGWPGERVRPDAAASRVYVAISTLRGLGLREVLVRRDDGYLLDAAVPLTIHPDGA